MGNPRGPHILLLRYGHAFDYPAPRLPGTRAAHLDRPTSTQTAGERISAPEATGCSRARPRARSGVPAPESLAPCTPARVPEARIEKTRQPSLAGKPGTRREGSSDAASPFPEPPVRAALATPGLCPLRRRALPPRDPLPSRRPREPPRPASRRPGALPGAHSPILSTCGAVWGRTQQRK